jgi:hypothetical protein
VRILKVDNRNGISDKNDVMDLQGQAFRAKKGSRNK